MPERSPYFLGAAPDWAFAGGASLAACAALAAVRPKDPAALLACIAALSWLLQWPHLAASFYRLVFWRSHADAFPWTLTVAPVVVIAGACACFVSPTAFAPAWGRAALWWLSWHVAEQSALLAEAYARRAGREPAAGERTLLRSACFAAAAFHVLSLENGPAHVYGLELPTARFPQFLAWGAAGIAAALLAAWAGSALRRGASGAGTPAIAFLPPLALAAWFAAAGRAPGARESVSLFHGLQYLLFCGACQVREQLAHAGGDDALSEGARWGAMVVAGGALLGAAAPGAAALAGADFGFATGVAWSSVQLYHFIADAVLWRWEDPELAARVAGGAA